MFTEHSLTRKLDLSTDATILREEFNQCYYTLQNMNIFHLVYAFNKNIVLINYYI